MTRGKIKSVAATAAAALIAGAVGYFFVASPNDNKAEADSGKTTEAAAAAADARVLPSDRPLKIEPK